MLKTNRYRNSRRARRSLLISALSLILAMSVPVWSHGQEARQDHSSHAPEEQIKIPQTPQDHRDLAERYQKNAAEYRQEIDMHKKMLADYRKGVAKPPKETRENPYIKKMRLHCEHYIEAAQALAREADEMAKFHVLRARELEGK